MDSSLIPVSSLISSIVLLLSLMHINIKVCSPFNMHFVFEIKHSTLEYFAVQTSFFFSLLKLFLMISFLKNKFAYKSSWV